MIDLAVSIDAPGWSTLGPDFADEDALADALEEGAIAGAASDVFADEPTHHARLLGLETFIGTAHVGGNSREAVHAVGMAAIRNLLEHLAGDGGGR